MDTSTLRSIRSEHLRACASLTLRNSEARDADHLRSVRHALSNRAAVLHAALYLARLDGVAADAIRDAADTAATLDQAIAALDRAERGGAVALPHWVSGAMSARHAQQSAQASHVPGDEEAAASAMVRIMVADDEPDIRSTLSEMLRGLGHDVRTAADGEAALTLARQWQPHVVLLDVFMPRMSGFVVARLLRLQFERAHMRIVMMTGYPVDEATLENAGEAGFDLCLDKAFTMDVLREAVAPNPPSPDFGPRFTSG